MYSCYSSSDSSSTKPRYVSMFLRRLQSVGILWLIAFCFLLDSTAMRAQSTYATVTGFVTDASGAVIPGATVNLVNRDTQRTAVVRTQSSGEYHFVDIDAGTYKLTVKANGFNDYEVSELTVLARQSLRIDASLKVSSGAVTVVMVSADSTLTSDSELMTESSGKISVSGGLSYFTSFSIDGISTTSVRSNGPTKDLFPSVDAISEFKVNSANNDAEFGQPSDITVTSRGARAQRGSGFSTDSSSQRLQPIWNS